jgi:DNA-binding NarL/FixJ family response regulator
VHASRIAACAVLQVLTRSPTALNLLLIDDHVLFRSGLRFLLSELDAGLVVLEAGCCAEARAHRGLPVDLVLLDLSLPGACGDAAIAEVRDAFATATQVVVSGDDEPGLVRRMIEAGAAGFIPKSSSPTVLAAALRRVLAGGVYLPPHVLRGRPATAADTARRPLSSVVGGLTAQQSEVLGLALQGVRRATIASELDLAEATVTAELSDALSALGVADRTEAVYASARLGVTVAARPLAPAR